MSQREERSTQPELAGLTHWLIHHAARRAPESLSSRLEEEWLADLASRPSTLSRLRFALGCCWATLVIVSEYPRSRVPATSAATAARGFMTPGDRSFGYFSLRSGTLFLIAGLHAALFYALITALPHTNRTVIPPNLQNQQIESVPPKKVLLPLTANTSWKIAVPRPISDFPPTIKVDTEVTTTDLAPNRETDMPPLPPAPPTHVIRQVAGGPGAGFPETADFYPSWSIHLGEEGLATVRVCVDPKGRLTSEPTTVKTSGSARLDEGALRLARAGSGHYRPTTEDGQSVNSCYPVGIRFQLKK